MPQISNFRLPRPMGYHWVQKMGQNRKRLPCPKIRIFDYPAVIVFLQKMEVMVMVPNQGGDPLGSILGPMGSHWVKKWVKTVKNYHAPKFGFSQKMEVTVMAPSHGGDPQGSILGPMGSQWDPLAPRWTLGGPHRDLAP